jgi:hypothetical protein
MIPTPIPASQMRDTPGQRYVEEMRKVNDHYNGIQYQLVKVRSGYRLYAVHAFYNHLEFEAGPQGPTTQRFINSHYRELKDAGIVSVGVHGRGEYATGVWLNVSEASGAGRYVE